MFWRSMAVQFTSVLGHAQKNRINRLGCSFPPCTQNEVGNVLVPGSLGEMYYILGRYCFIRSAYSVDSELIRQFIMDKKRKSLDVVVCCCEDYIIGIHFTIGGVSNFLEFLMKYI